MNETSAVNADQFKQSFREEGREVLIDLEAAQLELNESRNDLELVGRVFRALHTIKCSGAMFSFEQLAAFTHNLETAFDLVRNGRMEINSALIDLTLSALDQIRAMLEEGIGYPTADPAACAEILTKVRQLAVLPEPGAGASAAPIREANDQRKDSAPGKPTRTWHVRFAPGPEMMLNGRMDRWFAVIGRRLTCCSALPPAMRGAMLLA